MTALLSWRLEYRAPDATGHRVFRYQWYTDRDRMVAAMIEMLNRPEVTQLSMVEFPTEQCENCLSVLPNCECCL